VCIYMHAHIYIYAYMHIVLSYLWPFEIVLNVQLISRSVWRWRTNQERAAKVIGREAVGRRKNASFGEWRIWRTKRSQFGRNFRSPIWKMPSASWNRKFPWIRKIWTTVSRRCCTLFLSTLLFRENERIRYYLERMLFIHLLWNICKDAIILQK